MIRKEWFYVNHLLKISCIICLYAKNGIAEKCVAWTPARRYVINGQIQVTYESAGRGKSLI